MMFMPGGLLVDAGAAGEMTLARTAVLPDTLASPRSVSNALGVTVTGAFVLDRLAFAGLVDAVDGVWIMADGKPVHMAGPAAADYILTEIPGEAEGLGIERFQKVLDSVLLRLPDSEGEIRQVVTSLGVLARTTIPTTQVVSILADVHAAMIDGAVRSTTVPTSVLRPGIDSIDVLQQPEALQLTVSMFPSMILRPGESEPPRVLLRDATDSTLDIVAARDVIVRSGFLCVSGGHVVTVVATRINVPGNSAAARAIGEQVAEALGLPVDVVEAGGMSNPTVDVEVTLGTVWRPLA